MVRFAALSALCLTLASSAWAADYRQEFPYPRDAVYATLVDVLPREGLKIKEQDPVIGRVAASKGVSGFSWGENLTFAVVELGPDKSAIEVDGSRKVGTNVLAGGRIQKHFDRVIFAVSRKLRERAP